ncbi:MAG: hypothetical protein HFH91_18545 [Lachnospiraceae bacterium]|nr:hypothetical protein [Lachnospiraceae bacterium]
MAFGAIELTTISRAQDYTTIKHNEDNKVVVDQANFSDQFQKNTEQNIREVHSSDDTQWHEKKPDAREKGNGQYSGDGGSRRKKKQVQDRVVVKGRGGFDMKI